MGRVLLFALTCAPAAPAEEASTPPYGVRIEHAWIPMRDGVRLAANLFRPVGAKPGERFPAILQYLPYRRVREVPEGGNELLAPGAPESPDDLTTVYFARRGYVGVHVDVRGTGRSEGRTPDREYSEQEQRDGEELIAWLARQPWSSGSVGMWGISWGGFNSLQLAARRPPALGAIIAVDATEDLFQDDVHYIDGLMHVDEYELSMDLDTAQTRAPDFPTDDASLAPRFDNPPWLLLYKRQQRDGPFWRRASQSPPYDRIRIPTFLIGGWFDGYRDSIPRMLEHLKVPVKAIVGPWNHTLPHDAEPGPRIEWRREAVRWWDRWLKGRDTGIDREPRLDVFVRHWHPPDPTLRVVPGEWRSEEGWPIPRARAWNLVLRPDHSLGSAAAAGDRHQLGYVPSTGGVAGFWWGEIPNDQRPADALSLVYETPPLERDVEILGLPRAEIAASVTAPLAHFFARLSDVAPDGTTTLVTGAGVSGAHRDGAERPSPLEPGRVYPVDIEMHFTSFVFPRGHRMRLAISNALWPMVWPTPYAMTMSLHIGGEHASRLVLPVVPAEERPRPSFVPLDMGSPPARGTWPGSWKTHRDEVNRVTTVEWQGTSRSDESWGRSFQLERLTYEVADGHGEVSAIRGEARTDIHLKDRVLTWRCELGFSSDATSFFYRFRRELFQDGALVREKTWEETIPRDHQ